MSVVIGRLQIEAEGQAAAAGGQAPAKRAPSPAAATPPPPIRVETQRALRHHRERLARLRSS